MKVITLKILGMHCTACAMNIDFDLEDLDGVKNSTTNYAKQTCEVEFDESLITVDQLQEQIKKIGYDSEVFSTTTISS